MLLLCEIKASVHIRLGLRFFLVECLHSVEEALSPLRQQQTRRRRKEESGGSGPLRFPNVEGRKKSWAEQDIPHSSLRPLSKFFSLPALSVVTRPV